MIRCSTSCTGTNKKYNYCYLFNNNNNNFIIVGFQVSYITLLLLLSLLIGVFFVVQETHAFTTTTTITASPTLSVFGRTSVVGPGPTASARGKNLLYSTSSTTTRSTTSASLLFMSSSSSSSSTSTSTKKLSITSMNDDIDIKNGVVAVEEEKSSSSSVDDTLRGEEEKKSTTREGVLQLGTSSSSTCCTDADTALLNLLESSNSNSNNDVVWDTYETMMKQVMTSTRVLKKDKLHDMVCIQEFLLEKPSKTFHEHVQLQLQQQREENKNDDDYDKNNNVSNNLNLLSPLTYATTNNKNDNDSSKNNNNNNKYRDVLKRRKLEFIGKNDKQQQSKNTDNDTDDTNDTQNQQNYNYNYYNWTTKQYEYAMRCLTYVGDHCAKQDTSLPIIVAWYKLKYCGMIVKENCISTYMYVLSIVNNNTTNNTNTTTASSTSSTTNDVVDDAISALTDLVLMEVATAHDLLYPPNEKTVTLRIKSLISNHNVHDAELILQSLPEEDDIENENDAIDNDVKDGENDVETKAKKKGTSGTSTSTPPVVTVTKRLRTFVPIVEYYCQQQDVPNILRIFQQMKQSKGVHMDVTTYALIISTLAEIGSFLEDDNDKKKHNDGVVKDNSNALSTFSTHGPELFDELMNELASDMMEISEEAAETIVRSFRRYEQRQAQNGSHQDEEDSIPLLLDEGDCASTNDSTSSSSPSRVTIGRVKVNDTTAICPITQSKLRLFALDDQQRQHVHDTLLEMARIQHREFYQRSQKGNQKKKRKPKNTPSKKKDSGSVGTTTEGTTASSPPSPATMKRNSNQDPNYGYDQLKQYSEWLE